MRKILKKPAGMLAVLLLFLFGFSTTALALEVPDLNRSGGITVTMQDPDTLAAVPGGTVTLYRVADVKKENNADFSFVLTGSFSGSNARLDTLDAALAQQLADYAAAQPLGGETKDIGADGRAVFENLTPGLFLLVQHTAAEGYYAVKPFLVSIPLEEADGSYTYAVDATPKMELLNKEPVPDTPSEPDTPGSPTQPGGGPQTGDSSRQSLWIALMAASLAGIVLVLAAYRRSALKDGEK